MELSLLLYTTLFTSMIAITSGSPFLLGGQGSSLSFFGASNPTPESFIGDLRKAKSSRIRENLKLNEEDDDFVKEPIENEDPSNEDDSGNIVLPSLLQKKIGKILNKLQILSVLRGTANRNPPQNNNNNNGNKDDLDDFDKEFNEFGSKKNETNDNNIINKTDSEDSSVNAVTKVGDEDKMLIINLPVDLTENIEPRIVNSHSSSLNANSNKKESKSESNNVNKENQVNKKEDEDEDKDETNAPSVVVYFMELFGSAVGLAYGVFAQLTRANGGNN